jgi:hypothetical protein
MFFSNFILIMQDEKSFNFKTTKEFLLTLVYQGFHKIQYYLISIYYFTDRHRDISQILSAAVQDIVNGVMHEVVHDAAHDNVRYLCGANFKGG